MCVHVFNLLRAPAKHLAVLVPKETCRAGRSRNIEPVARNTPHPKVGEKSRRTMRTGRYTGRRYYIQSGSQSSNLNAVCCTSFFYHICLVGDNTPVACRILRLFSVCYPPSDRVEMELPVCIVVIELERLETNMYTNIITSKPGATSMLRRAIIEYIKNYSWNTVVHVFKALRIALAIYGWK